MIDKLQILKGKSKLKVYQIISIYYNEMTYRRRSNTLQFEGVPFANRAEGISKICHGVLSIMKFVQTKPQDKSMKNNYFALY